MSHSSALAQLEHTNKAGRVRRWGWGRVHSGLPAHSAAELVSWVKRWWPTLTLSYSAIGRFLWCQVQLWHRGTCFDLHDLLLLRKCWALQIMNHTEYFDQVHRERKKTFLAVMCWFEIGCEHWVLVRDNGDCTGGHLVEPSYLLLDKTSEGEHTTFIPTVIKLLILWSRACGDMYVRPNVQWMILPTIPIPSLVHSRTF